MYLFCCSTPNTDCVHSMCVLCAPLIQTGVCSVDLSLYTVTCPLITDYHRLFVLWPVVTYKISSRSWRMPVNSLPNPAQDFFGKSNFISTNMCKIKTNTTQAANYHLLGPLSCVFSYWHKMADWKAHSPEECREAAASSVQGTTPVACIIQGDTWRSPLIFQTYYFMCKVINYTTDTSLVSSGPCGLNQRQILCR